MKAVGKMKENSTVVVVRPPSIVTLWDGIGVGSSSPSPVTSRWCTARNSHHGLWDLRYTTRMHISIHTGKIDRTVRPECSYLMLTGSEMHLCILHIYCIGVTTERWVVNYWEGILSCV